MTHPIATAKALYAQHGLDFEADLAAYLRHGYVYATPESLIMFKAIGDSDSDWHPANPRAWYVHLAVGKGWLPRFIALAPYKLPLLAWYRRKQANQQLRYYPFDRAAHLLTHP